MSTSYERTFRAEVLKENLASIAGRALWLETKTGEKLSFEAGCLANELLLPKYDNDRALDEAEKKYYDFKKQYELLKKGV